MMLFLLVLEFVAFPSRADSIFEKNKDDIIVDSSGSLGFRYNGKCHMTYPNQTLNDDKKLDWCSNIAEPNEPQPWVTYSLKDKSMKLKGYSIRSGCCYYACCCFDDTKDIEYCCCQLYSFSLLGSNDNKTWMTIHKVEKDLNFWNCKTMTYEFPLTQPFHFIRFVLDEKRSYCANCMALNQIAFYGEVINSPRNYQTLDETDNDESVSIIGKLKRTDE